MVYLNSWLVFFFSISFWARQLPTVSYIICWLVFSLESTKQLEFDSWGRVFSLGEASRPEELSQVPLRQSAKQMSGSMIGSPCVIAGRL